jgi:ABC-type uncharacterized transport system substrate-binding protein
MKKYFALGLLFIILMITPLCVWAHPHMFFTSTEEFVWKNGKLDGCWEEWTFDSYFSADIIYGHDLDGDGIFSKAETENVYNYAFINLRKYHYFTFIRQGNERSNPSGVSHFSARQKDGLLIYRFYIDLSSYDDDELYFAVYDYTYFCDVRYPDTNPVKLTVESQSSSDKSKSISPKYQITENKDYPVYYNPMGAATDTTVYYQWKPGLNTYYPREVRIYYE